MAVALRGYVQMTSQANGVTVAWPAGTTAGDLALVIANDSNGPGAGWTRWAQELWSKTVTAADLAGNLTIPGTLTGLTVFTAARGIGRVRERTGQAGITLAEANSGIFVHGWTSNYRATLNPATGKLGTNVSHNRGRNIEAVWSKTATATGWCALSGVGSGETYVAYELLPAKVPAAPTVTSPSGYVAADADIAVSWVPDGRQDAYRVKFTNVGTSAVTYLLADGTVSATPTSVASAATTAIVGTGQLAAGAYTVGIATENEAGLGAYSTATAFSVAARPTVDSITPTAAAEDLSPSIAWTMTAGTGSQTAWQVAICPSADAAPTSPTWLSAITAGADVSTVAPNTTEWTDAAALYAWVRVKDGALWSVWTKDNATFAVDWTPPLAPSSVTVTDASPMSVAVAGIAAGADTLAIEWSDDAKATWKPLTTVASPDATETVSLPLAAYGSAIWCRARITDTVDGVSMPSAWTVSAAAVTCTDKGSYLVDSADLDNYLAVAVVEDADRELVQGVDVSYGLGSDMAMVDRTETMGQRGSTTFATTTETARAALVAWLAERNRFWVRWNPEHDAYAYADAPATLVAVSAAVGWSRVVQVDVSIRNVKVDWVEQI